MNISLKSADPCDLEIVIDADEFERAGNGGQSQKMSAFCSCTARKL